VSSVFDTGEEKRREVLVSHLGEALGGERLLVGWHYVGGHLVARHLVRRHLVRRHIVGRHGVARRHLMRGHCITRTSHARTSRSRPRGRQFCKLIEKKCECEMSCECPR
jgi:hypothetical protein